MSPKAMIAVALLMALAVGFTLTAPDAAKAGPCNPSVMQCV